jgi:phospholipid/cholesterol/gamma-HCH transport system substrate-binding protein
VVKRARPELIGAFVLGAVALMIALVVILGSGLLFRNTCRFVLLFDSNVNGLRVGAPVKFRGVEIGRVTDIKLSVNQLEGVALSRRFEHVYVPVFIEIDHEKVTTNRSKPIGLDNPEELGLLIRAGLRGQLAMESILTGMLYVNLEMLPSTRARLLLPKSSPYHEIPTLPTQLEQIQEQIAEIVNKLNETDFQGFVESTKSTSNSVKRFIDSPQVRGTMESMQSTIDNMNRTLTDLRGVLNRLNARIDPLATNVDRLMLDTDRTMKQAESTVNSLQTTIEPGSPLAYKLNRALDEIAATAASMRQLTDYLQRNPSSLVRGKHFSESSGTQQEGR